MARMKTEVVESQEELPAMPPASPVGKAARAYRKACDNLNQAIEALKEKKGEAKQALVSQLKELGKDSILVDGYTYLLKHSEEAYDVQIKKPHING